MGSPNARAFLESRLANHLRCLREDDTDSARSTLERLGQARDRARRFGRFRSNWQPPCKGDETLDVAGWVTKILGVVWEGMTAVRAFFASPQVEIIPSESVLGRLDNEQLALLLKVRVRNESERPVLIRSLRVQYRGVWTDFEPETPTRWHLLLTHGWPLLNPYGPAENIERALRIPPVEVVERFAFFHLTDPGDVQLEHLEVTVEARFSRGKRRRVRGTVSALRNAKEG